MKENVVSNFDINKELADLKKIYNDKAFANSQIYNEKNDVRMITYLKILNIIRFYQIQNLHISEVFYNSSKYTTFLESIELGHIEEKELFRTLYINYTAFGFFINLFSAIESSLRLIYKELNKTEIIKFIPLDGVMTCIIEKTKIDENYKFLIMLLSTIRNLIHNYGVNIRCEEIEYNGIKYKFERGFIEKKYAKIDFILGFIKNDIIRLFDDIFSSEILSNIEYIQDDLEI